MRRSFLFAAAAFALMPSASARAQAEDAGADGPLPANAKREVTSLELSSVPLTGGALPLSLPTVPLRLSGDGMAGGAKNLSPNLVNLATNATGVTVEETELTVKITLASDVLFDFDKASIRRDAEDALGKVASALAAYKGAEIDLTGHTDSKGADEYNQRLSERRAESVKRWLVDRGKLAAARFRTKGSGEREPVAPNEKEDGSDDPDGRQKNRRVDILVHKAQR